MELYRRLMDEALVEAKKSSCTRRKYGAVLSDGDYILSFGYNYRVGRCCSGGICVRDRFQNSHAAGIERGAEIHAEMMTLIDYHSEANDAPVIYIGGYWPNGQRTFNADSYPCHMCAMMIKYAGIKFVVVENVYEELVSVPIDEIIEQYENKWQEAYV